MRFSWIAALAAATLCGQEYRTPAGPRTAIRRPGAESILPGGRMIAPHGRSFPTGPGAFGLAVSPDGAFAVTSDGGPNRYSLTLLDMTSEPWQTRTLSAKRREQPLEESDEDDWRSVFMGLQFAEDRRVFASEGNSGRVRDILIPAGRVQGVFHLNQGPWRDSYSADLAYDSKRGILYVVDQANFRVAVFDARTRRMIASVKTGRLPFRAMLSPDGRRLYVTNVGMFEYKPIPGADPKRPQATGLPFPAFGFPSRESAAGARRATARGEVDVPALGDPNVQESNSLCVIDVENPAAPRLVTFVRTGEPFGVWSLGGSSPSGLAVTSSSIYVANANQDTVTVIDALSLRVRSTIELRIQGLEAYRGILPIGMTVDLLGGRLLVAEAGINSVAVIDLSNNKVAGRIPSGWFPTAVASREGKVFVACAKGLGTGPNATMAAPLERSFQGELRRGMLSVYPLPFPRPLQVLSQQVLTLNGFLPHPEPPPPGPKEIRHVVIIVKENRTYDELFGDIEKDRYRELRGAPELARIGRRGWLTPEPGALKARADKRFYNITPNHHALAERYAFSDNFYADSEVSVDGHHWLVGSYPNAWTESTLMAAYGGQKDFRLPTTAPGRLLFPQSNSSLHPEEQLEQGAIWHHLERHGVTFRNYGEGFELAGVAEDPGEMPTGARFLTNVPMPDPLYRNTVREYAQYNMNIPDQYRAAQFIADVEKNFVKTGKDLPRLLYIHLPNDHMAKPRPADGYPFSSSYVADNDYALGRILEYLSKSPWWKSMAVLITEDDAQGGVDHVDSHRTVLLVVSPWAKKNYAARSNSSFPGLLKTAFRLLGIPPLNLYDATATDLIDCFQTTQPDFAPFEAIRPDPDIFIPENAKDPIDPAPSPKMDDPAVLREQHRRRQ